MTTLMKIIMNLFRLLEDSMTFPLNIFDNSYYTNYEFDSIAEMLIIREEINRQRYGNPETHQAFKIGLFVESEDKLKRFLKEAQEICFGAREANSTICSNRSVWLSS